MSEKLSTRELMGPYLILGIDKDADDATIEAHWAERVVWCRKGKTKLRLEDVHWARDLLRDPDRRIEADAQSFNLDLASGEVRRLARLYHVDGGPPGWEPVDPEPPVELPGAESFDVGDIVAGAPTPDIPLEAPAVSRWLAEFSAIEKDPWAVDLSG